MKFYVHCEDPEFTIVVKWETNRDGTLETVLDMFMMRLKVKFPEIGNSKNATLYNAKGKTLDLAKDVWKQIKHMDDLFVRFHRAEKIPDTLLDSNTEKGDVQNYYTCIRDFGSNLHVDENQTEDRSKLVSETDKIINEKHNSAITCVANKNYRNAMHLYNEILETDPTNRETKRGLITCYLRAGRYKDALSLVDATLKEDEKDLDLLLLKARALIASGDGDSAIDILMSYSKQARQKGGLNSTEKHDVQVLLAKAYLLKHQNDMAINILQGVLREDEEHTDALAEYASILFPLGSVHAEEAIHVLLTLLTRDPNDKSIKQKFADACSSANGMEVLKSVAVKAMQDAAALVFLATSLRDCGAIVEAIDLMEQALNVDPDNAHTVLTYVHMLEVVNRNREGIVTIKDFVHNNSDKYLHELPFVVIDQYLLERGDDNERETSSAITTSCRCIHGKVQFSDDERYTLAVFFTLIKLLYIKAELKLIPPLLKLLKPFCNGHDLHLTNIRNEAAYFSCISEVFESWSASNMSMQQGTDLSGRNCIYFLGDSHCIPPAWQDINVKGKQHLVYPVLSTGTKIWHLRQESRFYPKANFYSSVRVIPHGAEVITCLGEIDCRESLLVCWEKARYDTIEDAMKTIAQIYLDVLHDLLKKHHWTIYVHPVLPVLDLTRPIVMQFNKILAEALAKEPSLHWLDFVSTLLTDDGCVMKEEFKLDGTHVHPSYVGLVERAIRCANGCT